MKTLKSLAVVALVAIVSAFSANARLSFGPKVGLNVDNMHFDKSVLDSKNRCGFTVGVVGEYEVPVINLAVDLSLMYTRMESRVEFDNSDPAMAESKYYGKNFLEVPLNIKYKINTPIGAILKPYVFTGPSFALRLGKDKVLDTKHAQWGWNLGIGLELIRRLQIGASYTWGINDIAKIMVQDKDALQPVEMKVKNNYWTVTAAWLF